MSAQDRLVVQILEWRQIIYDLPEQAVPEMKRLADQFEQELKRYAGYSNGHGRPA